MVKYICPKCKEIQTAETFSDNPLPNEINDELCYACIDELKERKNLFIEEHEPPEVVKSANHDDSKIPHSGSYKNRRSQNFTTPTPAQTLAKKKIEEYWRNRSKQYRNWKFQKHWTKYKLESISGRIEVPLYKSLERENTQRIIQNFLRHFLRHKHFRKKFIKTLYIQFRNDIPIPLKKSSIDITDFFDKLIFFYPKVVSAEILNYEKELFFFYFTFCSDLPVSYALRVGLIHFRNELPQKPIERNEILPIMQDLLKGFMIIEDE